MNDVKHHRNNVLWWRLCIRISAAVCGIVPLFRIPLQKCSLVLLLCNCFLLIVRCFQLGISGKRCCHGLVSATRQVAALCLRLHCDQECSAGENCNCPFHFCGCC